MHSHLAPKLGSDMETKTGASWQASMKEKVSRTSYLWQKLFTLRLADYRNLRELHRYHEPVLSAACRRGNPEIDVERLISQFCGESRRHAARSTEIGYPDIETYGNAMFAARRTESEAAACYLQQLRKKRSREE